ncbi:hypothetical protein ACIQTV_11990, partial [Micrococcus luteus]
CRRCDSSQNPSSNKGASPLTHDTSTLNREWPQYLPKGTDLSVVSREELDAIQDSLNGRPRKTLGYLTPSEKLAEFLAPTA